MGKEFEDYADALRDEVTAEMAETFFGARRELEDSIAHWQELAGKLRGRLELLAGRAAGLQAVLFGADGARGFYQTLGVDAEVFLQLAGRLEEPDASGILADLRVPFAWTRFGRYLGLVEDAYALLLAGIEDYRHGTWYDDPKRPGRKALTPNYAMLAQEAERINERVATVNTYQGPTCALRVVRNMDPEAQGRRDLAGGPLQDENCGLDSSMAFSPVSLKAQDIPELPALPPFERFRGTLEQHLRDLYDSHAAQVPGLLAAVRAARPQG
ncbi:hypothetical protein dsx2_0133 [Desulfovibrio sp. X2]|uniref:hypothetical protein n=1 Tax=Desulfovibrio sp. X2 TaxID=941449 RepID=UPI000358D7BC|nr:hypothetical protein [Desulfovibrio sp. X2]EPR42206.1 hypothetical protein dsx2_0133 [Desulfovibrio sp. X2]